MTYVGNIDIWSGTLFILMPDTGIKLHKVKAELDCSTAWKNLLSSCFFTPYFLNMYTLFIIDLIFKPKPNCQNSSLPRT